MEERTKPLRVLLVESDCALAATLERGLARQLPASELVHELAARGCASRILLLASGDKGGTIVREGALGVDAVLAEPCSFAELLRRIQALGERGPDLPRAIVRGDLRLELERRILTRAGRRVRLGPKECAILERLLAADGAVVSAQELIAHAWALATPHRASLKVAISRLRAKLGPPPLIETVAGRGYRADVT
jgi:DNA-binding response OmpR family regulator